MTNVELANEIIDAVRDCNSVEEVQDFLEELKEELEVNEDLMEKDVYTIDED